MIFVECKPDRLMVRIIADVKKKEIRHAGNKFEVMKQLDKYDGALGIIDEDPGKTQPSQIKKAKDISKDDIRAVDLIILSYRNNIVLILRPRLEEWLLKTTREINIDPRKFKLPRDPKRLHSVINYNLDRFVFYWAVYFLLAQLFVLEPFSGYVDKSLILFSQYRESPGFFSRFIFLLEFLFCGYFHGHF